MPSLSHAQNKATTSILLFGDSIIAGYGLNQADTLSVQLEKYFSEKGRNIKVINGGVSGDTTAAGRARLEWVVKKHNPDMVFLALGGNDLLRGFPPREVSENIDAMLTFLKTQKIPVILSKVTAPANLGPEYMASFNSIYIDMAKKYGTDTYPFLLEKIFGNPQFMQADRIHPTAAGAKEIARELGPFLEVKMKKGK